MNAVLAHVMITLTVVVSITVLTAIKAVPSQDAVIIIMGAAGIAGPAIGRQNQPSKTQDGHQ